MLKINLKEFKYKESFKSDSYITSDVREQFADLIYKNANGIRALKLAERIYESDGEIELDNEDEIIFISVVNELCTAQVVDSVNSIIDAK